MPPSPCTGVCRLDGAGVCAGCGRTLREIGEWPGASPARKQQIVRAAARRRAAGEAR